MPVFVISAVFLFRTWGFPGIASLLSSLRRHQHIPANEQFAAIPGLTRLVPDTEGWPSSHGGWVNRPGTDRMQHFLLDQILCLWSLSSFFANFISLSSKSYCLSFQTLSWFYSLSLLQLQCSQWDGEGSIFVLILFFYSRTSAQGQN